MTVEVYAGPGDASWASTKYSVDVAGNTAFVYGFSRTAIMPTDAWAAGATVEESWLTFGTTEDFTEVGITRLAGAITSVKIYPGNTGATYEIVSGDLILQVPPNVRLRLEFNGQRVPALNIFASPLKQAVPGATTAWPGQATVASITLLTDTINTSAAHGIPVDAPVHIYTTGTYPTASGGDLNGTTIYYAKSAGGTSLTLSRTVGGATIDITGSGSGTIYVARAGWTDTVNALYFGPGVHQIGMLFQLADNVTVYIDGGAVVKGSFDLRQCDGVVIAGPGVLSGYIPGVMTPEIVAGISAFNDQRVYSMFFGDDDAKYRFDNTLQGITVVASPFYHTRLAIYRFTNTHFISPWYWSCDGFNPANRKSDELVGYVTDCFSFAGDDAMKLNSDLHSGHVITGSFFITSQNACLQFGYFPELDEGVATVTNCHAMHIGIVDTGADLVFPVKGGNSIVRCLLDGFDYETLEGRKDVTITNLRVWGPIRSRLFTLWTHFYQYGPDKQAKGQIQDWTFNGIYTEETPEQLSVVEGTDRRNGPHDLFFDNVVIEGVKLTARNWTTFFEINAFAYRIWAAGTPVVTELDLCNRALGAMGDAGRITSINPPDGSTQAAYCAQLYQPAVNHVLERHSFGVALKRIALTLVDEDEESDTDQWAYRYEIPDGMLAALAVLPEGCSDDYGEDQSRPYAIELDEEDELVLYTNEPNAILRYTKYLDNPGYFTPLMQEAIVEKLAGELAARLRKGNGGEEARVMHLRLMEVAIARAKLSNNEQRRAEPTKQAASIRARRGMPSTAPFFGPFQS